MFKSPKNGIWKCFQSQLMKSTLETRLKAYATVANVQLPQKVIWQCFQSQLKKSILETRLKAYTVVANVQLPQKRYLAVFSKPTNEIYFRNAFKGICSSRKSWTSPKTLFGSIFKA